MNVKLQDVKRVLFLRKDPAQILQVKARHFSRLKSVSAIAICFTIISTFVVVHLSSRTQQEVVENNKLQSEVTALQAQIDNKTAADDSLNTLKATSNSQAVTYIEGIQAKLKQINDYLRKRGLAGITYKKINTDGSTDQKLSDNQLYSTYDDYLTRLVADVSLMPMGYPHIGALTSFFGYRSNPFDFGENEFHPGIDFKGHIGDQVKCTASGKVIFAGREGGYGNCIHIQHANNIETWYGHLSHINVHEGQRVSVGDVIGRVGSTGRSTGPHLHYEIRKNGKPINPIAYLSLNR